MCENVDSREAAFELAILVSFYKSTVGVLLYFFYYFEMGECPMFLKWEWQARAVRGLQVRVMHDWAS